MATFTPPSQSTLPPVLPKGDPEQSPLQYNFGRHLHNRPEGINVYILSDNTVTETDPDGSVVVWAPNDRNGDAINAKYVVRAFYGSGTYTDVSSAHATLLQAAGYTVT